MNSRKGEKSKQTGRSSSLKELVNFSYLIFQIFTLLSTLAEASKFELSLENAKQVISVSCPFNYFPF